MRRFRRRGRGPVASYAFAREDATTPDVAALIDAHVAFARGAAPLCHAFAMTPGDMARETLSVYSCREDGVLVAVGALREVDERHVEIKSMHVAAAARGRGLGRRMLAHLLSTARARGAERVSLETGTAPGFDPARRLYASAGFEPCAPFGDYPASADNVCLTLVLAAEVVRGRPSAAAPFVRSARREDPGEPRAASPEV